MLWALHSVYAAGLQRQGGCGMSQELCAAPKRTCSILAVCDAPLWAKSFPKATVILICSFCKDLKQRSIKLHFLSWKGVSWLVIIFGSCLGKGFQPLTMCWGCWGTTAEAGWYSQQLLCKQKLLQPLSTGFVVPALKQRRQ